MSKFQTYIRTTKFKALHSVRGLDSFDNQFSKNLNVKANTQPIKRMSDSEGLSWAYKDGDTHVNNKTLYVAGTNTWKDVYDDITKVPFWGDTRESTRYRAAEKVLKENPQIENIVGHSLGGAVSLELQKQYPERNLKTRTYGSATWDPAGNDISNSWKSKDGYKLPKVERYRNYGDPVCYFDSSAENSMKWFPFDNASLTHTYKNIGDKKYIEEDYGK